jgi:hypothetical protein
MSQVDAALGSLEGWIDRNGWAGYDPYDVKSGRILRPLQRSHFAGKALNVLLDRFPMAARKILFVRPRVYAKAIGLFADGYLSRYEGSRDPRYLEKAEECLKWLLSNPSPGYSGICWGYPFDWQSLILIPAGTPSGVVTSVVVRALLHAYRLTMKEEYLEACRKACAFIRRDLKRVVDSEEELCFSYTPLDDFRVHNANLFCAASLAETGSLVGETAYLDEAARCVNYTMRHQQHNGAWYYWGPPEIHHRFVDSYHTGFVLECAQRCRNALGIRFVHLEELNRGLQFYRASMFLEDGLARISNTHTYPVDIHSCAQGIITLCALRALHAGCVDQALKIARWTITKMQDPGGFFYYRVNGHRVNRMPFIRWGQAWMLHALSTLQRVLGGG